MIISKRAKNIKPFIAMDIIEETMRLRKKGIDVISFSLGEPDFKAPEVVQQACIESLQKGETKYTHSQGLLELRMAIVDHYKKRYDVCLSPDQIIVTQGTSPAFFLIFSTLLEKGDEVILPNPHYPCDANFVEFLGGKPVFVPVYEKDGYDWNIKAIQKKITSKTKAIFVTSPSNPTGVVLKKETLSKLCSLQIPVVSDELYHGLTYSGDENSVLEFNPNSFVVNGFSKTYAMTGFRLGYLIAPPEAIRPLQKVQQNFHIAANTFVQHAAIKALTHADDDLKKMKEEFKKRRDVMYNGLKNLGFKINYQPNGAFYIFVSCKHINPNSYELAFDILKKAHVAITPGVDFGSKGESHLRFSYAIKTEQIIEGLNRLENYLNERK